MSINTALASGQKPPKPKIDKSTPPPTQTKTPPLDPIDLPDCQSSQCTGYKVGMPNWRCQDGRRGGPVCKRHPNGKCRWRVVHCPKMARKDPPGPVKNDIRHRPPKPVKPKKTPPLKSCKNLPDNKTLKTWKIQSMCDPDRSSCAGPCPPEHLRKKNRFPKIRDLGDGTFITEKKAMGCFRVKFRQCFKKCLPGRTLIATPQGEIPIKDLVKGMPIWTQDKNGTKIQGEILWTFTQKLSKNHKLVQIQLADGRSVSASVGHPTLYGEGIEGLRPGDAYDGTRVTDRQILKFGEEKTYDILPSGETGIYWANRVPLTSTLVLPEATDL